VTTSRLRDTFALLLREGHKQPAALSAGAERTIRRRVGLRWAGRIGALVVAGALGTAAAAGAYGGWGGDSALPSPIVTPTIGVAKATFPVAGGPEFVSAAAGLKCGDPVPTQHSTERNVSLALAQTHVWQEGEAIVSPDDAPTVKAFLSQAQDTEMGVLATSGISLIVAHEGVVVGVSGYSPTDTGWNSLGSGAESQGAYPTQLLAPWISCPGVDPNGPNSRQSADLEQGTYDVMAIARVFSTPESVALHQIDPGSLSAGGFDTGYLDPNAIYLPGSWDCAQAVAGGQPPRACLPDYTDNAGYDPDTKEVTVLYDPSDLVEEFSEVLVSQPVAIAIPGADALPASWYSTGDAFGFFDSIDDFTCGASAEGNMMWQGPYQGLFTSLSESSVGPISAGATFSALVLAGHVPDGSHVDLLPGARLVYLQDSMVADPESNSSTSVQAVVGWSELSGDASFTVDRFSGPQTVSLTSEAINACPGVDLEAVTNSSSFLLVGTWHAVAPDGTVTSVDVGSPLEYWGMGG